MLSLSNAFNQKDLEEFIERLKKDEPAFNAELKDYIQKVKVENNEERDMDIESDEPDEYKRIKYKGERYYIKVNEDDILIIDNTSNWYAGGIYLYNKNVIYALGISIVLTNLLVST